MSAGDDTALAVAARAVLDEWDTRGGDYDLGARLDDLERALTADGPRAGDTAPDDEPPRVPSDVARRWKGERDEAYEANRRLRDQRDMARREVDRLRSEVAALRGMRDAGNALADEAYQAAQLPTHGNDHRDSKRRLSDRADAWRSAAGGEQR